MKGGSMFDSPELRHLWNKARAALTKDPPLEDSKKTLTLEVRPEEVKVPAQGRVDLRGRQA